MVNGYLFSKLLYEIHPTFIKRTRKNFTLEPGVLDIRDNNAIKSRTSAWETIERALPKFGIKLGDDRKQEIIAQKGAAVAELLGEFYKVDNNTKQLLPKKSDRSRSNNPHGGMVSKSAYISLSQKNSYSIPQDEKSNTDYNPSNLPTDIEEPNVMASMPSLHDNGDEDMKPPLHAKRGS